MRALGAYVRSRVLSADNYRQDDEKNSNLKFEISNFKSAFAALLTLLATCSSALAAVDLPVTDQAADVLRLRLQVYEKNLQMHEKGLASVEQRALSQPAPPGIANLMENYLPIGE